MIRPHSAHKLWSKGQQPDVRSTIETLLKDDANYYFLGSQPNFNATQNNNFKDKAEISSHVEQKYL